MIGFSVIILLLFFIISQMSRRNQSELNRTALQTKLHDDEIKLNELMQWNASIRAIRHDLNNHLSSLKQLIKEEKYEQTIDYIKQIENNISGISYIHDTNCSALNAILDTKYAICNQENIDLKCYLQNELPELDNYAFSTVFGNLFDNAIEASKKENERAIRLAVETFKGCIRITMQNKISSPVLVNGKLPATTKKDTYNHGLGMYSVTDIINKYEGAINMYEDREWLVIDVLLPCLKIKNIV
jgi:sensor histidine kinase regulating citrate/malate metabolism